MIIVECPHCKCHVEIVEMNCAIFRHGAFAATNEPIPPHASKEQCEQLKNSNAAIGCCKPFKCCIDENGTWFAVECDYI